MLQYLELVCHLDILSPSNHKHSHTVTRGDIWNLSSIRKITENLHNFCRLRNIFGAKFCKIFDAFFAKFFETYNFACTKCHMLLRLQKKDLGQAFFGFFFFFFFLQKIWKKTQKFRLTACDIWDKRQSFAPSFCFVALNGSYFFPYSFSFRGCLAS